MGIRGYALGGMPGGYARGSKGNGIERMGISPLGVLDGARG